LIGFTDHGHHSPNENFRPRIWIAGDSACVLVSALKGPELILADSEALPHKQEHPKLCISGNLMLSTDF
jgi:hypothetical protein